MKTLTRRDLAAAIPALGIFSSILASGAFAEAQAAGKDAMPDHCRVYEFASLPASKSPTGSVSRAVMHGTLPTGEIFEIHETTLGPGQSPHPPHHHMHSEWMLIREGQVEFSMGTPEKITHSATTGPGGVCYARSGEMHGIKNTGTVPANYFVIAVGNESA
jgi:mannose-6-phosphate isomerase-like protein (cupin superfamily)